MQEEIDKILQEIREKSEQKYGKIQKCCGFYQEFCRCNVKNKIVEELKNETPKIIQ